MNIYTKAALISISCITLALNLTGCSKEKAQAQAQAQTQAIKENIFTYVKYDLPDKIKLGDPNAKSTFYFVFDYTCPFCKKWKKDVLPELKKKYINAGVANYISQPLPLLSKDSLRASEVDYSLESKYPEKYYELQSILEEDSVPHNEKNTSGWASEEYYKEKLKSLGISYADLMTVEIPDRLTLMRKFMKTFGVQTVPSLYINGVKVYDPFDLSEIDNILSGRVKAGDSKVIPQK